MLTLLLASSFCQRLLGLHAYDHLTEHTGLWIAPCRAVHTLGMAYPIDLLYLDLHGQIIKRVDTLLPNRWSVCWSAASVVELPAGYCLRHPNYSFWLRQALLRQAMV